MSFFKKVTISLALLFSPLCARVKTEATVTVSTPQHKNVLILSSELDVNKRFSVHACDEKTKEELIAEIELIKEESDKATFACTLSGKNSEKGLSRLAKPVIEVSFSKKKGVLTVGTGEKMDEARHLIDIVINATKVE